MATLLTHPAYLDHETGTHPERPDRLRTVERVLEETGGTEHLTRIEPEPGRRELLTRVHAPEHVDRVQTLSEQGGGRVDPDTVASAGTWRAAELAAGGAVEAGRLALAGEPAFNLCRPPGHHATRDDIMGFCFLNNVAVAAAWALREGGCERVAIVDHDVHHGNGTQDIFYDRDDVLYVSVHQSPLYPGTGWAEETGEGEGEGHTVNVPLWADTGERGYRQVLEEVVLPVTRAYDPDLLLVSAGFDAHERDPLANLRLSSGFFAEIAEALLALDVPTAFTLEGGYDLEGLARSVAGQLAVLAGEDPPAWDEPRHEGSPADHQVQQVVGIHGARWALG